MTIVRCPHCDDTGERPVADIYGEYDMSEPCICPAGETLDDDIRREIEGANFAEFDVQYAWMAGQQCEPDDTVDDLNDIPF